MTDKIKSVSMIYYKLAASKSLMKVILGITRVLLPKGGAFETSLRLAFVGQVGPLILRLSHFLLGFTAGGLTSGRDDVSISPQLLVGGLKPETKYISSVNREVDIFHQGVGLSHRSRYD